MTPTCSGASVLLRQQPVGGDGVGHRRGLHAELVAREVPLLELLRPAQRRLDERAGRVRLGALAQVARQRARVDADADGDGDVRLARRRGHARLRGGVHDLAHVLLRHRAGVDAHAGGAGLDGRQRQAPVVVDVGDDRHAGASRTTRANAGASSAVGRLTRTISQPAATSARTCASVASASPVRVHVIDCTATGAPPPTGTAPTWMRRRLPIATLWPADCHVADLAPCLPVNHAHVAARPAASVRLGLPAEHPAGAAGVGARVTDVALARRLHPALEALPRAAPRRRPRICSRSVCRPVPTLSTEVPMSGRCSAARMAATTSPTYTKSRDWRPSP